MTNARTFLRTALLATALIAAPALADGPIKDRGEAVERAHFERDRETILAMAGDYKVRFDMQESTPWMAGYEPLDRKISGGHESVRVIEDTGTKIVLQHLLVVGAEGEEFVIKHWRQDWEYEPETRPAPGDPHPCRAAHADAWRSGRSCRGRGTRL